MAKVLSTTSRLYLGVFGLLMFPVLSAAIIGFVLCLLFSRHKLIGLASPVVEALAFRVNSDHWCMQSVPSIHSLDQLCLVDFLGSEHVLSKSWKLEFLCPVSSLRSV
jgi:hypothetical protein